MQSPECYIGQPHLPHAFRKEAVALGAEPQWISCEGFGMSPEAVQEDALKERAKEIYEATMCGGAGCCGDIDGAIAFLIKELKR